MAGQLLDLATVPEAMRQLLEEGVDYKTDFTYQCGYWKRMAP
jgi:hypothetical protein